MDTLRRFGGLVVVLALAACGDREPTLAPAEPEAPQLHRGGHRIEALISGTAHHTRTVGTTTALTIFAFHGWRQADGRTRGLYHYDFRAAGFSVQGPITCISIAGNQAWVGGTVARIDSPDPEDQSLVGADMWWRSIDNGFRSQKPDSTTGVGFAFPGGTITAESWCRDQPQALVLRQVEKGNLVVKGQ
jgi:hypothetical protein